MDHETFLSLCNKRFSYNDNNIYGDLILREKKRFVDVQGTKSRGYVLFRIEKESEDVYSPSGKKPMFNLANSDPIISEHYAMSFHYHKNDACPLCKKYSQQRN